MQAGITRGRTAQNGAGIANFGALTMEDCTVFDNEANDDGGGIFQEDPATSLTATNCLIEQNKAIGSSSGGGGIYSGDNSSVTLTDCVIRNNQSTSNGWRAGGIEFSPNAATTYTLTGCEVGPDNSAAAGAGIFAGSLANVVLDNTTVQGNHAGFTGGGIQVEQGATLTLQNGSVVRDNDAGSDGGGISSRGAVIIDDSTVGPTNTAGNRGGGIFNTAIPLGGIIGTIDLSADSSIIDNHATIDGGGVLNQGTIDCNGDISGNTVGDPEAANNCIDDGAGEGCAACPA